MDSSMFYHVKELQYQAKPEKPDPLLAKRLQEILAGKFGLLLDTGTEELANAGR
jgi:Mn-containing catalase